MQASVGALAFWWDRSSPLLRNLVRALHRPLRLPGADQPLPGVAGTSIARILPFHAILGFPVELMVGRLDHAEALTSLGIQWAWVATAWRLLAIVWRRGVRAYGAFGA
ncbi:MAG: ABC-2 family transporter protein [Nannocystaceae bacterium]